MRKKRIRQDDSYNILNLDSLVDIVSNKVGILIILAVIIAILSLQEKNNLLNDEEKEISNIEKIKIPWSHSSQKNSLLFLLRENQLIFFDRVKVFRQLSQYLSGKNPLPNLINLENFSVKLTTGSRQAYCIEFLPNSNAGNWWHQDFRKGGLIEKLKNKFPSEENYFFFWVDAASFATFKEIRNSLWEEDFEVGWKPIQNESILQYCSGNYQKKNFQPQ